MLAPTGYYIIYMALSKCIQTSIVHAAARLHMSTIALSTNKFKCNSTCRSAPTPLGGAISHLFATQTLPPIRQVPRLTSRSKWVGETDYHSCNFRHRGCLFPVELVPLVCQVEERLLEEIWAFQNWFIPKTFIKEGLPINLQNQQQGMASKLKSLGKGVKIVHFESLILF